MEKGDPCPMDYIYQANQEQIQENQETICCFGSARSRMGNNR
jgi:hypothetical protein